MTGHVETTLRNHSRALRFFWSVLIGATTVSLIGNVAHAVLPYISRLVIQIGAATVPPIALLAAVHGIALAVRAGASGMAYRCALGAVAAIGIGAFALSFLALRDLMLAIGYSAATAWIFPAIIDTTVAVSTLMLVALGDKPARRSRTGALPANTQTPAMREPGTPATKSARAQLAPSARSNVPVTTSAAVQPNRAHTVQASAQTGAAPLDAKIPPVDAEFASELIATGATTQPVETVIAVLSARLGGASINAAAKTSGINYRTAQRIVEAAAAHRHRELMAVG
ncbi:DUF2637 domain-containing protein [Mycobacterium sp. 050128]|uniref:DUF2637 domain-containing protein n=1 Tax=Mycobacterium sp. 050128 TaxID=3096112 RepID=UPI002ED92B07